MTQVRLDFLEFDLANPSSVNGVCSEESLSVVSGNDPRFAIPTLCGENAGKHSRSIVKIFILLYLVNH